LFALAMASLAHDRFALFVPALALCALNRETSVFLLPLALGARPISRRLLIESGIATAIWAAIYVLLRVWKGAAWYDPWNVSMNLTNLGLLGENYDFYYRRYAWFFVVLALPGFAGGGQRLGAPAAAAPNRGGDRRPDAARVGLFVFERHRVADFHAAPAAHDSNDRVCPRRRGGPVDESRVR
jgi:hypothetical protein